MELYLSQTDPWVILTRELPSCAKVWSGDQRILEGIEYPFVDKALFARFYEKYRAIVISAGLPRNDYGQTVSLYEPRQLTEPNVTALPNIIQVPNHLMGENLSFKPSAMADSVRYQLDHNNRYPDSPRVAEQFFFAYHQSGCCPERFVDLGNPLQVLRYLSTITHELSEFRVVLLETGVYIRLSAYLVDRAKPPFRMGS
jgi:hypothetical protein